MIGARGVPAAPAVAYPQHRQGPDPLAYFQSPSSVTPLAVTPGTPNLPLYAVTAHHDPQGDVTIAVGDLNIALRQMVAMQRWPAAPKPEAMRPSTVLSITASGMTTMWFLAPPSACTRLPAFDARS